MTYAQVLDYIECNKKEKMELSLGGLSPIEQSPKTLLTISIHHRIVWIKWEDGSFTIVLLPLFFEDALYECAMYTIENNLLDKPG